MGALVVGDGRVVDEKEACRAKELIVLLGLHRFGLALRRLLLDRGLVIVIVIVVIVVVGGGDADFEDRVQICFDLIVVFVVIVGGGGGGFYVVFVVFVIELFVGRVIVGMVIVGRVIVAELCCRECFE
jgi:hypothetical protein